MVYEKYTLFDSSNLSDWLAPGFLCIQRRGVNTYFDCISRYFFDPGLDQKHIVFLHIRSFNQSEPGLQILSVALFMRL